MKARNTSYHRNALIAVGVVLALALPINIAGAQDVSAERSDSAVEPSKPFFPPGSRPFDRSFPQWTAEWWQYVFSIPVPDNPVLDVVGTNCMLGQHGPVWFLFGSFGSTPVRRTCSIPEDRALLFPIINTVNIAFPSDTIDGLRAQIAPFIDAVNKLSVEVDGETIEGLRDFRIKSVPFSIALPTNGLYPLDVCFETPPLGVCSPVVGDGYYVMLKPLSVGQHTIHIFGQSGEFKQDITYVITTVAVRLK
jgi:hypothetical protein